MQDYNPTPLMAPTSHYDKQKADYAVSFIECLSHTKGDFYNKPFKLLGWQKQIIRDLFGVIKPNGYRQFNTAYIECPKKQGKTELAAAVALLMTCGDGEQRAEVFSAAADRQEASIIFMVAKDMVQLCPALASRCKIMESQKRIIYKPTNSFYQVLSADAKTKHGFSIHCLCFDELHNQPNDKLFNVLTKGSGDARKQPLMFIITTAGNDIHSVCYQQHQKAQDILDGRQYDPTFYPVIYGAPMDADWTDPEVWKKANPSLGVTIEIEKLEAACNSAKQNPAEENVFRQLRLCQWTKQTVRWMPMEKWDACAQPVDARLLEGRPCYAGLDLSSTTDLTSLVLVFPPQEEGESYQVLPYFWVPDETMDLRVRRDHVNYDLWARQNLILTTEGNVVDYDAIIQFMSDLSEKYDIREVAYDRWNSSMMVSHLTDLGFTMVGQGFASMSEPTKQLMRLVLGRGLAHGGHPVLRWCMDNVVVRTDAAGNIKMDKSRATELLGTNYKRGTYIIFFGDSFGRVFYRWQIVNLTVCHLRVLIAMVSPTSGFFRVILLSNQKLFLFRCQIPTTQLMFADPCQNIFTGFAGAGDRTGGIRNFRVLLENLIAIMAINKNVAPDDQGRQDFSL